MTSQRTKARSIRAPMLTRWTQQSSQPWSSKTWLSVPNKISPTVNFATNSSSGFSFVDTTVTIVREAHARTAQKKTLKAEKKSVNVNIASSNFRILKLKSSISLENSGARLMTRWSSRKSSGMVINILSCALKSRLNASQFSSTGRASTENWPSWIQKSDRFKAAKKKLKLKKSCTPMYSSNARLKSKMSWIE